MDGSDLPKLRVISKSQFPTKLILLKGYKWCNLLKLAQEKGQPINLQQSQTGSNNRLASNCGFAINVTVIINPYVVCSILGYVLTLVLFRIGT